MTVPGWSAAWDGGAPPVIVGNAAEFNGQFGRGVRGPDHYSCLAAFCAARPAMVLLPMPVEGWWIEHVGAVLGWADVEVHSGLAADARMCAAVGARPDLLRRIAAGRSRVLPWGWTAESAAIAPGARHALRAVRRYESKRHAHALFGALADAHPRVAVPAQHPLGSPRALARELEGGRRVVLKREYGVGGEGTLIVSGDTPGLRPLLRRWARDGALVEEYAEGSRTHRDVTFDAVVAADGWVHPVGAGLMHVDGTAYRGVTVGPGVLPGDLADAAAGFGAAVGRALAADGYRGWFDVDFVATASGRLAPTEINLRLTGPAAAFHIQATLDRRLGGRHVVRTADRLPLGARLPAAALREHVAELVRRCRNRGGTLLVTIPTAAFDPAPYLAVAIAARTAEAVEPGHRWSVSSRAATAPRTTRTKATATRPPRPAATAPCLPTALAGRGGSGSAARSTAPAPVRGNAAMGTTACGSDPDGRPAPARNARICSGVTSSVST